MNFLKSLAVFLKLSTMKNGNRRLLLGKEQKRIKNAKNPWKYREFQRFSDKKQGRWFVNKT
ncbi:MAG: hypothetical protein PUH00_06755 [Clostridiales bacterium]|uniref:hypothetical protein n=1 Tax=Evtepia sp. TaxID=2773933 RepID=UPI0029851E3E|nr:hypothetical protein [Evtepia sp.]MDD7289400.1 hypothetical protein [Clostridiales bacterium]MDY4429582.1 hypothetical protein [Evtepia sp.]